MKALRLLSPGVIKLVDVEKPSPVKGTVVIRVLYSALNRRDLWIVQGMYRKDHYRYPVTLGSDVCGVVCSVGEGVNPGWLNKHVIVNSGLNWGPDQQVSSNSFNILGMPTDGTLAEYLRISVDKIYEKPHHLTSIEAATIPLAGLTAWRACHVLGQIKPGQNVLISGIGGGVSLTALMFSVGMGANVFVTSSSEKKIEKAKQLGAKGGVLYTSKDWSNQIFKLTNKKSIDVVIDGSVGPNSWNNYIRIMSPGGKLVFYGATAGAPEQLDVFRAFLKQISILGCTMGSDQDFKDMLKFISEKKLKPYVEVVYPFSQIESAILSMDKGTHFGKIAIEISKESETQKVSKL